MRLLSIAYFPYEEDRAASDFLRSKIAEYDHYWIRQGRFALISTEVDPHSLFDSIKPFLGEFDTLVVSKVIDPICFAGRYSEVLWNWIDRFSSPN
jgi:hypothetical protein